jgi:hypothetical protein
MLTEYDQVSCKRERELRDRHKIVWIAPLSFLPLPLGFTPLALVLSASGNGHLTGIQGWATIPQAWLRPPTPTSPFHTWKVIPIATAA